MFVALSGIHLWTVPESSVVFSCGLLISGLNGEYLHNAYFLCSKKACNIYVQDFLIFPENVFSLF